MSDWPRMLKRQTAAQYCDLSVGAFEREITIGRLPAPITLGGRDHWCRNALDKALDRLTGAVEEADYRTAHRGRYGKAA